MDDRLEELLAKYWTNQISAEEKAALENMMWEQPDYWLKSGLLQQLDSRLEPKIPKSKVDKVVDSNLEKERPKRALVGKTRKRFATKLLLPIVILFLMGGALFYFFDKNIETQSSWEKMETANGIRTSIRLADGTKVWLNAGSVLKYSEHLEGNKRQVYLTGEAYFKVAHNADRPFIIHTAHLDAKVLGTEVNIRAYADESYSEAILINGAVNVMVDKGDGIQQIQLELKQKIIVNNFSPENEIVEKSKKEMTNDENLAVLSRKVKLEPIKVIDSNLIAETAWKQNTFLFKNETLGKLSKRLMRWYGVDIIIKDSVLAKQRFTGRADNVSLKELLKILQMIKPFDYEIEYTKLI